jgi:hypothetical protein
MRFGRIAWGIMAGVAGLAAGALVQYLETQLLGSPRRGSFWIVLLGAGGGVLWVADRFGLMAPPYVEPTLGLGPQPASQEHPPERGGRIAPIEKPEA